MKKKILLFLMAVLTMSTVIRAQNLFSIEGIWYQAWDNENKYVELMGYEGTPKEIVIPQMVTDGGVEYTVKDIRDGAFDGCSSLVSINIPDGVTYIGAYAFRGCTSLNEVHFPDEVTSILPYTFDGCSSLVSINIPDGVTSIGDHAFEGCSSLTLLIPPSVKNIGEWALHNVYKVIHTKNINNIGAGTSFTYDPDNIELKVAKSGEIVSTDGKILFAVPKIIGEYTIPDGVETVIAHAFDLCSDITTLTIPSSIKNIEPDAFRWLVHYEMPGSNSFVELQFERVNFEDWGKWYSNVKLGNIYSNPYRNSEAYAGGVRITAPELKEGMTEIPDYINMGLPGYENEVELPSTLKRIGAYAFFNNKEMYRIVMPEGLISIGDFAFAECELLENPIFPSTLKEIGDGAFIGCNSISEILLPQGLIKLGSSEWNEIWEYYEYLRLYEQGVFNRCSNLEKVILHSELDYIPYAAFADCEKLYKVYLPLNVKRIAPYAFMNCKSLDEIIFPQSLESIGRCAFECGGGLQSHGSLSKIIIPNNVKTIGELAFYGQNISSLSFGTRLETIESSAFAQNPLKVIKFSEGLQKIGEMAFSYSDSSWGSTNTIGSIVLPNSLDLLSIAAFKGQNIANLVIPDGLKELPSESCGKPSLLTIGSGMKTIAGNAIDFVNLHMLRVRAQTPPALTEAFSISQEQNDNLTLVVNNSRSKFYETSARWKQIDRIVEEDQTECVIYMTGEYPLAEEIRTTTGLMPSNVTKMKVVGPLTANDLKIVGENMISLMSLDMSEVTGVTSIPAQLFENSLISELILPVNLKTIGERAFANSRLLRLTELPSTVQTISNEAFADCLEVKISRLPEALKSIGSGAFRGCSMTELVADVNLSSIKAEAFQNCTLLETVDLASSKLTQISDYAFSDCTALDNVILPESVTSIGQEAFRGTAIRDIAFASGVSSFGDGAFSNCRRLVAANLPETVTNVPSNMFANCNRLITLSMPASTASIGVNLVNGDKKLANISCAANDAPSAEKGAFDNVRYRYISLVVPGLSYRPYLDANQWGKFESIQNKIPVKMDMGVKVSVMLDDEYQDMLREDALEEQAENAAIAQATRSGDDELTRLARNRQTRAMEARAATPRYFASVFDGAQIQTGKQGGGARIFLNPEGETKVTSILYNGVEMIDKLDGNSLLLPEGSNGSLEIRTNSTESGVQDVLTDNVKVLTEGNAIIVTGVAAGEAVSVYTLSGVLCNTAVSDGSETRIEAVAGNYYIVKAGKTAVKVRL